MMVCLQHVVIVVSFQLVLSFQPISNFLKLKGSHSNGKLRSTDYDDHDENRSNSKLKFQTLSQVSQRKYDYISLLSVQVMS